MLLLHWNGSGGKEGTSRGEVLSLLLRSSMGGGRRAEAGRHLNSRALILWLLILRQVVTLHIDCRRVSMLMLMIQTRRTYRMLMQVR
jgi:hypothetical protein